MRMTPALRRWPHPANPAQAQPEQKLRCCRSQGAAPAPPRPCSSPGSPVVCEGGPGEPPHRISSPLQKPEGCRHRALRQQVAKGLGTAPRSRLSFHAHLTQNIPRTLAFAADRTCLARHGLRGLSHRLGAAFALARTSLARARPRSLPRSNRGHLGLRKELTRSSYLTAAPAALVEREIGPARSASLEIHYLLLISGNYSNWM